MICGVTQCMGLLLILSLTLHFLLAFRADHCRSSVTRALKQFFVDSGSHSFPPALVSTGMGSGEYFHWKAGVVPNHTWLPWIPPCYTWGAQVPFQPLRNQFPSSSIGGKFNNLWGLHSSSYMYHTKAQLHQLPPSTKIWLERDWGTSSHAKDFKFTTYGISTVIAYNTGFTVNTLPGTSIWSDP